MHKAKDAALGKKFIAIGGSGGVTVAAVLARTLLGLSVRPNVFLVSGNQLLSLIDSFGQLDIPLVHARHESGAGYMAEGWGRVSEEPGFFLVAAGPGLTNGLTPLFNARLA